MPHVHARHKLWHVRTSGPLFLLSTSYSLLTLSYKYLLVCGDEAVRFITP